MPFDIDSARKAGYKDSEIAGFLSQQHPNFDVQGAMKAGYSIDEIAARTNKPKNQVPDEVRNEPGLQEVLPVTAPMLDAAGNAVAESKFGQAHPIAGAAVGTAIAKAPEIAATIQSLGAVPETAAAVEALGKGAFSGTKMAIGKLQSLADAILGQGEKAASLKAEQMMGPAKEAVTSASTAVQGASNPTPELMAAKQRQAGLSAQMNQKAAMLTGMKKEAGAAIGAAEEAGGIGFKELPDKFMTMIGNKEQLGARANTMARLADMGPNTLAQNLDPATIQLNRKIAQEALKRPGIDDLTRVQLARFNSVAGDALGQQIPDLKEKLSAFKDISQALNDLPKDKKIQADALKNSIQRITNDMQTNKMNLQQKVQYARQTLDQVSKQAEALIQQGKQRDLNRALIGKIATGTAIAAGAPTVLRKLTQ